MNYEPHDIVVLLADLPDHDLRAGDVGTIVQIHADDMLEVEFVTASGRTTALVTLSSSELRAVTDSDRMAIRSIARSA